MSANAHNDYNYIAGPMKHGKACGCISCLLIHNPDCIISESEY